MYAACYEGHPFTVMSDEPVYLKQVVNTNYCFVHIERQDRNVLVTSVIDNLLKGHPDRLQNMNLMFGLEETMGLGLKASYF